MSRLILTCVLLCFASSATSLRTQLVLFVHRYVESCSVQYEVRIPTRRVWITVYCRYYVDLYCIQYGVLCDYQHAESGLIVESTVGTNKSCTVCATVLLPAKSGSL